MVVRTTIYVLVPRASEEDTASRAYAQVDPIHHTLHHPPRELLLAIKHTGRIGSMAIQDEVTANALDTSPLVTDQAIPKIRPLRRKKTHIRRKGVGWCQSSSKCTPQPGMRLSPDRGMGPTLLGSWRKMSCLVSGRIAVFGSNGSVA